MESESIVLTTKKYTMKNSLSLLVCILFTLTVNYVNAQAPLIAPQPTLWTDQVSFNVESYAALRDSSSYIDFPITYWVESVTDTENVANFDSSAHVYFDKNDPDAQFYNVSHCFMVNKLPQTWYFFREHGVDTFGNHYYSQYVAMKTAGTVSAISEPAQKTCSVIVIGKQLQVKSPAEYMGAAIQVYNILGEKVFHTTIENEKQTIDLSGRASGAYYLVSLEPTTSSAKKVVMRIYISP